jgi:exodeoxyribonuclease VII small subunit
MKYTEAKEELDKIITEIDRGDADIDTLSEKIKRAGELITLCRNKLRETEDNVENILSSFENNNRVSPEDEKA